jgi:hypothetical protein
VLKAPDKVLSNRRALMPQPLPSVALSCHTMNPPLLPAATSGQTWSPFCWPTMLYSVPFAPK